MRERFFRVLDVRGSKGKREGNREASWRLCGMVDGWIHGLGLDLSSNLIRYLSSCNQVENEREKNREWKERGNPWVTQFDTKEGRENRESRKECAERRVRFEWMNTKGLSPRSGLFDLTLRQLLLLPVSFSLRHPLLLSFLSLQLTSWYTRSFTSPSCVPTPCSPSRETATLEGNLPCVYWTQAPFSLACLSGELERGKTPILSRSFPLIFSLIADYMRGEEKREEEEWVRVGRKRGEEMWM